MLAYAVALKLLEAFMKAPSLILSIFGLDDVKKI